MRYLCMIYLDDEKMRTLPPDEVRRCVTEQRDYLALLQAQGHGVAAHALQPAETATCITLRGGKLAMTDGPYAETSEQFGGFFLIEARDLNEAIRLASHIPLAQLSQIEVRPLL